MINLPDFDEFLKESLKKPEINKIKKILVEQFKEIKLKFEYVEEGIMTLPKYVKEVFANAFLKSRHIGGKENQNLFLSNYFQEKWAVYVLWEENFPASDQEYVIVDVENNKIEGTFTDIEYVIGWFTGIKNWNFKTNYDWLFNSEDIENFIDDYLTSKKFPYKFYVRKSVDKKRQFFNIVYVLSVDVKTKYGKRVYEIGVNSSIDNADNLTLSFSSFKSKEITSEKQFYDELKQLLDLFCEVYKINVKVDGYACEIDKKSDEKTSQKIYFELNKNAFIIELEKNSFKVGVITNPKGLLNPTPQFLSDNGEFSIESYLPFNTIKDFKKTLFSEGNQPIF